MYDKILKELDQIIKQIDNQPKPTFLNVNGRSVKIDKNCRIMGFDNVIKGNIETTEIGKNNVFYTNNYDKLKMYFIILQMDFVSLKQDNVDKTSLVSRIKETIKNILKDFKDDAIILQFINSVFPEYIPAAQ